MCQVQIPPNQITFSAILPAQHWHCALDLCMASLQSDIVMDRVTFEAVIRWGNPIYTYDYIRIDIYTILYYIILY